jgi:hypothetical protein
MENHLAQYAQPHDQETGAQHSACDFIESPAIHDSDPA